MESQLAGESDEDMVNLTLSKRRNSPQKHENINHPALAGLLMSTFTASNAVKYYIPKPPKPPTRQQESSLPVSLPAAVFAQASWAPTE
jgi:hypothetical protein